MTFTPADKKNMQEIEEALRHVRTHDAGNFPNDVAILLKAQEKLNDLIGLLLMRVL